MTCPLWPAKERKRGTTPPLVQPQFYDGAGKQWVMFYYGLGDLSACDGVAVSDDLYHWRKFPAPILTIGHRRSIDAKYAHKPAILYANGSLYHFYCACRASR